MTDQELREDPLFERTTDIIAATLGIERDQIALHSPVERLSRDSIQLFELVTAFERSFQFQVAYEDLMAIETVRDIVLYLKKTGKDVPDVS